jgi:DNA-binding CsgD family transcriptional regulator
MTTDSENLMQVVSNWRKVNHVESPGQLQKNLINEIIASIFSPGKYYYFILDFFDLGFEYVHPTVEEIIGCTAEDFNFNFIFEKMHPNDAANIQLKESAAMDFFYNRIPPNKIPLYKSTYTFRIADGNGGWKTILHQSIALQVSENGRVHHSLSVHSDITFLNSPPDDRISFVGINGEPSFYALSTDPDNFLQPEAEFELSIREREVIQLLAEGLSSKQIAGQLFLSQHTVDTHRRNLLKKTGTKNTLELTVVCLKKGLI